MAFPMGARPRRVLDLGADTSLLTGVLLAAGHGVVAVDRDTRGRDLPYRTEAYRPWPA